VIVSEIPASLSILFEGDALAAGDGLAVGIVTAKLIRPSLGSVIKSSSSLPGNRRAKTE
jgi:hypothetical protein